MMKIAVLRETASCEKRVAASAETVRKFIALGAELAVETGAGLEASVSDADYAAAGATIGDRAAALKDAGIILCIQGPDPANLTGARPGALVVGGLNPFGERARVDSYAAAGLEALAMEFMPRITRAQSMDILSSQANLAGYKAVLDAASEYGRAFPMMMTAAGTVSAARVFIMGVGVAGLQAIATARRLGAQVSATDVRAATKNRYCRWAPSRSSLRQSLASKAKAPAAMPRKCPTSTRRRRPNWSRRTSPSRISSSPQP